MQIFRMHSDGLAHHNFFKLRNFQLISKHIFSPAVVLARCKSTAGCIVEVQCPSCHFFGNKDSGGGDALILKPFLPLLLLQLLLLLLIIFISILLLLPFSFSIYNSSFFSPTLPPFQYWSNPKLKGSSVTTEVSPETPRNLGKPTEVTKMPSIHLMCSDPILRWRELKKSNISAAGLNRLKTSVFAPLHSTGSVQHTLICPTVKTLQLLWFTTPHTIRGHSEELDIIIGSASAHAQRTYIFSSLNAPCLLYTRSPV